MSYARSLSVAAIGFAALVASASALVAAAADVRHGAMLYELRCGECHSESVHGRQKRVAADFEDVRKWVNRWSENLKLGWSAEDIDDVTAHLNDTYYHYPCPPRVCKTVSLSDPALRSPAFPR